MTRLSLGRKFVLAFVGLSVLFAATFGTLAAYRLRKALLEQVRLRAKGVAEELARDASRFLPTPEGLSEGPISSRLTRRLVAGTVLYAQIARDGEVRFSDGRHALAVPAGPLVRPFTVVERRTRGGTAYLDIFRAVPEYPLERQTYVRIGFPLGEVHSRIRAETERILLASLLMACAGVAAAFALRRAILGPLARMSTVIRLIRRGDYSARVKAEGGDELQLLADEFNTMVSAIEARDRELARVNTALTKANHIKDEFTAAMSHELKTPLHAVRAYAQLLLEEIDGPVNPAQRKDLEALLAAGDHLLHLIEGILRYSALEAGGIRPQTGRVDAGAVIEQACQNVAHLVRQKGLTVEVAGTVIVEADETMLRQILINLLHNAVKYTERGKITVTAAIRGGLAVFEVTDTGTGIPKGHEHEVFEPFQRAGHPARRAVDGIGLGLAVVKRYVELHGGRVWFERAAGGGTRFTFTLPAPTTPPSTAPAPTAPPGDGE